HGVWPAERRRVERVPSFAAQERGAVTMRIEESEQIGEACVDAASRAERGNVVRDRATGWVRGNFTASISGRYREDTGPMAHGLIVSARRSGRAKARARHAKRIEHALTDQGFPARAELLLKHSASDDVSGVRVFEVLTLRTSRVAG